MSVTLSISKQQLAELPTVSYPGTIVVVNTRDEARAAMEKIRHCTVTGFDTETRPSFRKGQTNNVALVQISTGDTCYLFRVNKLGITDELIGYMEDEAVTKVGLSLRDDFHVMRRGGEFEPKGFIDLQNYVKDYSIIDCSLQKIYGILFNQRISKSQRLTNWEASQLTYPQQLYASIDAWACLNIYDFLSSGKFIPDDSPYAVQPETDNTTEQ